MNEMQEIVAQSANLRRKVLVVDDEFVNRQLLGMILSENYEVLYAENGREALGMIKASADSLSLVMLDLIMPEMDGYELLEILKADEATKKIPVIVLTSEERAELRSLKLGAADFIKKPYDMPEIILARVGRIIELNEGRSIIQAAERDDLTGLYTGAFFLEYASQFERHEPETKMDAVVINIDRFHLVNELYGREFGDRVLRVLAKRLQKIFAEPGGLAARVEGDTFYVFRPRTEDYEPLLQKLQDGLVGVARTVRIHLRIGVRPRDDQKQPLERCFDRAKTACNMLRGNYTKSILVYDSALQRSEYYSESLINDVHKAVDQRQFSVFFQPKFAVQGDKPTLACAEALVRWHHPEYGMVSPGDFIPLFENNGLIGLVDHYVWQESAAQIARWRDEFGVTFPVSVNVSRVDLYDPALTDNLLGLAERYGIPPAALHLEVTESAYTEDTDQIVSAVQRLRDNGFLIEMDDFGSGYSSMNMLFTLPIDVLKLDMMFVRGIEADSKNLRLIEFIMDIANYLQVPVVSEGVETQEQYELLKSSGCQMIQGYYFSRPLAAEEFTNYFREGSYVNS